MLHKWMYTDNNVWLVFHQSFSNLSIQIQINTIRCNDTCPCYRKLNYKLQHLKVNVYLLLRLDISIFSLNLQKHRNAKIVTYTDFCSYPESWYFFHSKLHTSVKDHPTGRFNLASLFPMFKCSPINNNNWVVVAL